ncbi:MAG: hypothetical protein WCP79_07035 [Bacillota bacterium]
MKNEPVEKIDATTGEVIERYNSLQEAGFDNKVFVHDIRKVLKGTKEIAGGFKWRLR